MPRGLNAKEETFGSLLRGSQRILVPIYQRSYEWTASQFDALWEDLETQLAETPKNRNLFLGAIVFNVEQIDGELETDLVDGQQRMLTLTLILGALRHRLMAFESNKGGRIQERIEEMIFDRHPEDLESWEQNERGWSVRLRPATKDRENYARMLFEGGIKDKRHLIADAWKNIHAAINTWIADHLPPKIVEGTPEWETATQEQTLALSEGLVTLLDNATSFAVIEVSEPHNPFAVFESLNSKGLELAQGDLIKNYLLKKLPEKRRDGAVAKWDHFVSVLPRGQVADFLRHYFVATSKRIPKAAVYKSYKKALTTDSEIQKLLDNLERHAYWYSAFVEGELRADHGEMQGARNTEPLERQLDRFSRVRFKQGLSVLLAFVESTDPRTKSGVQVLVEAMEILEAAFVRLFVSGNLRGSVFEAQLNEICSAARADGDAGIAALQRVVARLCKDNKGAQSLDWAGLVPSIERARFLLYRIAEHQLGEGISLGDPDQWHVEHVLPQVRGRGYERMKDEDYENLIGRIGNLTLLLSFDNQGLKNLDYGSKTKTYALYDGSQEGTHQRLRPNFPMNREIAKSYRTWDEVSIEKRSKALTKLAEEVWPIPN